MVKSEADFMEDGSIRVELTEETDVPEETADSLTEDQAQAAELLEQHRRLENVADSGAGETIWSVERETRREAIAALAGEAGVEKAALMPGSAAEAGSGGSAALASATSEQSWRERKAEKAHERAAAHREEGDDRMAELHEDRAQRDESVPDAELAAFLQERAEREEKEEVTSILRHRAKALKSD